MKNIVISTALALAFASTLGGSTFAAEGDYYQGIDPHMQQGKLAADLETKSMVRYGFPMSAGVAEVASGTNRPVDSGDYYQGVTRPH